MSAKAPDFSRAILTGAVIWATYSLIQILINGVVVDETIVPAQIINGTVTYPHGHPHEVFYRQAFSLAHYSAAALWSLVPDAMILSAARNWLFLFSGTMSVYALTMLFVRRTLWGHVAVGLFLLESTLMFNGSYPMWSFPSYYSNGHTGLQLAVLAVALLLGGMWRSAGFLVGLFPSIHAAIALLLWLWSGLRSLVERHLKDRTWLRRFVPWFLAGAVACVALGGVIAALDPGHAPAPVYDVHGDADAVREAFRTATDTHRKPFRWFSLGYVANPVAFFGFGVLLLTVTRRSPGEPGDRCSRDVRWLLILGGLIWAELYGMRLVESLGFTFPGAFYATMPTRFSNITAVMLVPLAVATFARSLERLEQRERHLAWILFTASLAVAGVAAYLLEGIQRRDFSSKILLLSWGLMFACAWRGATGAGGRRVVALGAAFITAAFAVFVPRHWGVVYLAIGTIVSLAALAAVSRWSRGAWAVARAVPRFLSLLLAAAVAMTAVTTMSGRQTDPWTGGPRWDKPSPSDLAVKAWLRENAEPDELLLVPMMPRFEGQAKTGHPVILEMETLWIMAYMSSLAPRIGVLVRDLYGVDYADPARIRELTREGDLGPTHPVWKRAWRERTREEWQALGRKYGFRLILTTKKSAPLDLPVAMTHGPWAVHVVDP